MDATQLITTLNDRPSESPLLHLAARVGDGSMLERAVEILTEHGVNLDASHAGFTALHVAVICDHACAVAILLEAGADPERRDPAGRTALHLAAQRGWVGVMALLLRHGGSADGTDSAGRTPLMTAAFLGRVTTVERLLEAGARCCVDVDGHTAMSYAIMGNNHAIARLIYKRCENCLCDMARVMEAPHGEVERMSRGSGRPGVLSRQVLLYGMSMSEKLTALSFF